MSFTAICIGEYLRAMSSDANRSPGGIPTSKVLVDFRAMYKNGPTTGMAFTNEPA